MSVLCQAQLNLNYDTTGVSLVQRLLGNGISVSNVTRNAAPIATGYFFNRGGLQFDIDSGIVLANGRLITSGSQWGLDGPSASNSSTNLMFGGDADLSSAINTVTSDASILEFDFVPLGDSVRFRYVFASDEYPRFVCSPFNDAFAFFISGPGFIGLQNMALVPGTKTPVGINTVNSGKPGPGYNLSACTSIATGSPFTKYYVDNTGSPFLTLNGHTVVMEAVAEVLPCQSYHLKIVIADGGSIGNNMVPDRTVNSAVFLEGRSLQSAVVKIIDNNPQKDGAPFLVEGCNNGGIKVTRSKKLPVPQVVNLSFSGTALNGVDVNLIPSFVVIPAGDSVVTIPIMPVVDNLVEGSEYLKIFASVVSCNGNSFYNDSIVVELLDFDLSASVSITPADCFNRGIISIVPSGGGGAYSYSLDGINFQASNQFNVVGNATVIVRDGYGCTLTRNVVVPLQNNLTVFAGSDTTLCEGTSIQLAASSPATAFSWSGGPLINPNAPNPIVSPVSSSTYHVIATVGNCTAADTVVVSVLAAPDANAGKDTIICFNQGTRLNGSGGNGYSWLPVTGVDNASIPNPFVRPETTSSYFLKVTGANGCESLRFDTVQVVVTSPVKAFAGRDTLIAINQPLQLTGEDVNASGATSFTWTPARGLSNPGIANPVVVIAQGITYKLEITTPGGCKAQDEINIKVYQGPEIYVPSGFTPNRDGKNDVLRATLVGMKSLKYFNIYDRWGQLVFTTTHEQRGWNGTTNGLAQGMGSFVWIAEATDYTGKPVIRKGVVTLVR